MSTLHQSSRGVTRPPTRKQPRRPAPVWRERMAAKTAARRRANFHRKTRKVKA